MKVYYCSLSLARKFPAPATVYGGQVLNCSLCSSKFRSNQACEVQNKTMGRAPCCDKTGIKKGPWTPQEDQILIDFIRRNGHGNWRALPKQAGLLRCGKSCRLRWINYLRPDIKHGNFSSEEEEAIIKLHQLLGNRWSAIASRLPGRTDNEIKNVWNTHLKKRLLRMGIDPVTHAVANHSLAGQSLVSLDSSEYSEESPSMKEDNLGLIQAKTSIDSPTTISNFSDTFYDSHNLSSEILSSINSIDSEVRSGDSSSSLDWVQSSCINSFDEPLGCNQQPPAIEDDTFIFGNQDYASEISTHEVMWEHTSYGKAQYFMSASPEEDFLSSMGDADTNPHLLKNLDLHTIGDDSDGFGYWLNVLKQVRPSPVWM